MGVKDFLGNIGETFLEGDVGYVLGGALGRRKELAEKKEKEEEEEKLATGQSFLNAIEQGQAEGAAAIGSLVESTNRALNNKVAPAIAIKQELLRNYENVYNNISPDKRQSLYNLLQQDQNAFR